ASRPIRNLREPIQGPCRTHPLPFFSVIEDTLMFGGTLLVSCLRDAGRPVPWWQRFACSAVTSLLLAARRDEEEEPGEEGEEGDEEDEEDDEEDEEFDEEELDDEEDLDEDEDFEDLDEEEFDDEDLDDD